MKTLIRTRAVLDDLICKISKAAKTVNTVVQIVVLGYFGYEIYKSIGNIPFLICYSVLFVLALTSFIAYLSKKPGKTKGIKQFKKVLKWFKYPTRVALLVFNVYDKVTHGHTELEMVMLIISGGLIAFNLVVDLVVAFVNEYVKMLDYSFNKDIEPLTKVTATIRNKYALLDLIPEALAKRIEGEIPEEPTPLESHVEEITATFIEKEKAKKGKRKEVHKMQKQAAEEDEKKQLKHHLKVVVNWLFGKKKKKGDDANE